MSFGALPALQRGTDHHDRVLGMVGVEPQHVGILERLAARPVLDDGRRLVLLRFEHVAQAEQPGGKDGADGGTPNRAIGAGGA